MGDRQATVSVYLFVCLLALFLLVHFSAEGSQQKTDYAGEENCQMCHEDIFKYYSLTPHKAVNGCESCHGPGKAHVESEGDTALIFVFKSISGQEASEVCLRCHGKQVNQFDYSRSDHGTTGLACNTCHQPHASKILRNLLKDDEIMLCYSCHKEIQAQFLLPERHRAPEGMIKCSDCHNVHYKMRKFLISRFDREELCGRCHRDKTGPFVYEHQSSLIEGCTACHTPHGSINRHLLLYQDDRLLCLSCHPVIPGFHNNLNFAGRRCTDCHAAIHGSNISRALFR